jgi:hypothetical protein
MRRHANVLRIHERTSVTAPPTQPIRVRTTLRLSIGLSETSSGNPSEKMPSVRCATADPSGSRVIGEIRTDVAAPRLDVGDHTFAMAEAHNIISRVLDEQAWLAELHRVIAPGGFLSMMVPAAGPLAWLDSQNIYRYITDITGRGTSPSGTLPTGWNRHYHEDEVRQLVEEAGFSNRTIERIGIGLAEIPHLAGLVVGDFLLKVPAVERRLHPGRERLEGMDQEIQIPRIGKTLYVLASRT